MASINNSWKAIRQIVWQVPGQMQHMTGYVHSGYMMTPHGIVAIARYKTNDEGETTMDFVYAERHYRRFWRDFLTSRQCSREAWKLVQETIAV